VTNGITDLCPGDSLRLETDTPYAEYHWSNGGTTPSIIVKESGEFTVMTVDSTGCAGTSDPISVRVHPAPAKPELTLYWNTLVAPAAASYRWFRNDSLLDGESGGILLLEQTGIYSVEIANEYGCINISDPFVVDIIGIRPPLRPDPFVQVYPDPTDGLLTLAVEHNGIRDITCTISNILGVEVWHDSGSANGGIEWRVDLRGMPHGMYILSIHTGNGVLIRKIHLQ
jgi:hypothetical protein